MTDYGGVRVDDDTGRTLGTGIAIGGGQVLTCTHLANGDPSEASLVVTTPRGSSPARVVVWSAPDDGDCAALAVERPDILPAAPAWAEAGNAGQAVRVFGYPQGHDHGLWIEGHVLGAGAGRVQISTRGLRAGFSGAPVIADDRVIGMVVSADREQSVGWMIPTSTLARYLPRIERWTRGGSVRTAGPGSRRTGPPAYTGFASDAAEGAELLGRYADIEAMATLIAARETAPPLSVGLFGDWGSGKTFFMAKLREEIDAIGRMSAAAPEESTMCAHIRQVVFNAWHYTDADLWASLVAQIFTELAEPRGGETRSAAERRWGRERSELVAGLETSRDRLDRARARLAAAETEAVRLRAALADLERRRTEGRETLTTLAAVTTVVRDDPRVRKQVTAVRDDLDLQSGVELEQIRRFGDDGLATYQRISRLWRMLGAKRRAGLRRRLWAAGAVAAVLAVVVPLVLQRYASAAVQLVAGAVAFVAPLAVAGQRVLGALGRTLRVVENAADVASKVEQEVAGRRTAEEKAVLADLRALDTKRTSLQQEVLAAEGRSEEAQRALEEAASGRRLTAFIHERSTSEDYSGRLGTIAMIRRDFQRLDELLARSRFEADGAAPVDRIVLYVDDLDRCPPDRVVEVLQAIHLLLGLRLFVVVVGVDPRWLMSSLELHFERVLGRRGDDATATHWAATPVNYLEKIFQIPFNLAPMTGEGFARLIDAAAARPVAVAPEEPAPGSPRTGDGSPAAAAGGPAGPSAPAPGRLNPRGLRLDERERVFAHGLLPLIGTPRAGKRLVNLYRLTRAALPEEDLAEPAAHRPLLVLLAILVGFPTQAPRFFTAVQAAEDADSFDDFLDRIEQGTRLHEALRAVRGSLPADLTIGSVKPWVGLVARYSFHTAG